MKSRSFILAIATAVVTVLTTPNLLAAQDATARDKKAQHRHYKLIDIGTFGGSSSCINEPLNFVPAVNSRGNTVGTSATAALETSTSNPTAINCGGGQNVFHGFEWRNGTVTDLGTLAGPDFNSDADSVNDRGVIEGISENGLFDPGVGFNQVRAVIWKDGEIRDLGTFGGLHSWSFGINNRGQVVGMALNNVSDPVSMYGLIILGSSNSTQTRAFLWQNGAMQDLGTLGGPDAWAWAINKGGQVLGWSYTNSTANPGSGFPTVDPFFWEKGKMQDVGTLGGVVGFPIALNNRGQAIGGSSTATNPTACWVPLHSSVEFGDPNCHPFFWDSETLTDLNTSTAGGIPQTADAINNAGEIVGAATFPTQVYDAYLRRNGTAIDLGHINGDCYSEAWAINGRGQIVGNSFSCGFSQHAAFLWEEGSLVDLNSLIPTGSSLQLVFSLAINDHGEIAGDGVPPGVSPGDVSSLGHAFLLIPCDDDHPNVEGCDYSMVDAAEVANNAAAPQTPQVIPPGFDSLPRTINHSQNWFRRTSLAATIARSAPIVTLSPTSLTFATQAIGTISGAKNVTLKNTGTANLTITSIGIVGTNPADFAQTHACGSSLAAGASCSISVTFKPTASGTRTAALNVTDSAAGSPQSVSLTGTGWAGTCNIRNAECTPHSPPCCPGLTCRVEFTRAFCEE